MVERSDVDQDDLRELAQAGRLYAVLDCCDSLPVQQKVYELGLDVAPSLFKGSAADRYWRVAPHVVQVDSNLLAWIHEILWGDRWGVLVLATEDLEIVRKQLRKLLLVHAPDGAKMYFRFYDPLVLERFLPTCDREQLDDIYGPIEAFGVTRDGADLAALFTRPDAGLPSRPSQLRSPI